MKRVSKQLSLTGLEAAPRPTDRLFFAIFPDAAAATRVAELAQHLRGEYGLRGKLLTTERFHVTLHHLGDYVGLPQDVVAMATEAAAGVAMPPFDVAFDRAVSFSGRPRSLPLVLSGGDGVAALRTFQQALGVGMMKARLRPEKNFTPHMTLLYGDRAVTERNVETVGWTVREFVLVHSLLGRTRHIPLARWPLRG
jgi:2'-5' RNA ligase